MPDYIIAVDASGHEMVCHYAMGTWCEMSTMDVVTRLRTYKRAATGLGAE